MIERGVGSLCSEVPGKAYIIPDARTEVECGVRGIVLEAGVEVENGVPGIMSGKSAMGVAADNLRRSHG